MVVALLLRLIFLRKILAHKNATFHTQNRYHTLEQMNRKKLIKYILLIGFLILIGYVFIRVQYGSIDYSGTLSTKYQKIENSTDQIIETDFFELKTPENWTHLFGGYGTEGDPYGNFQTRKGVIHYEYGHWAPNYSEDDDIYEYKVEKKTINRFQVNIAKNKKGEIGICIPKQNEMQTSLTFYLDESVANNFDEIIEGIREIKFK
ncbi:hypothetical protein [Lacinutrix algicola]|uniref:hypothetical protein n=1 Tax=Lacinutrix algicola TaxID=342954 RepID=UPI0006E1AC52|nr:hypothetical protein [Lacinutrix algicola]